MKNAQLHIRDAHPPARETGRASSEVKRLAIARADELRRKAEALEAMRRTLMDLAERCHGDDRPDCPIIERIARG